MDESKKINAGKYRNKQRYKNKAKIVPKQEEQNKDEKESDKIIVEECSVFQKRSLESNWYRYEPKQEDERDSSRDFSVLASAPISLGSYFQFKSDKNIAITEDIKQINSALFHLDVNLLNLGIGTVPFHIQCGIDEKYFTKDQLRRFMKDAQDNNVKYESYLKSTKEKSHKVIDEAKQTDKNENNVHQRDVNQFPVQNIEKSESEDLEQWLEDVLDD